MSEPQSLRLIGTRPEAGNITTFMFDPAGLSWVPGQYQAWELPHEGEVNDDNEHWFTIASAPSEGTINISTRMTGSPFKTGLAALKPGDSLKRHDLDGDFIWTDNNPVIFVAAGIGITPYRAILLERAATGLSMNATLLYFTRDDQIPFRAEFDNLAERFEEFTVKYIVGEPVTAGKIIAEAPDSSDQPVYLSGPEPMVQAIGEQLASRGVRVKRDEFPGYTEANY